MTTAIFRTKFSVIYVFAFDRIQLLKNIFNDKMNAMNSKNFNFLEHSCKHSWSECHFPEHSWCEHEHSSSNHKSIFVSGVSA